jgi:hypothetical protein
VNKDFLISVSRSSGNEFWRNEAGEYHRLDGPAIISADAHFWYIEGKLHRLDGPAIKSNRLEEWYVNGKRHRFSGPAIIQSDGRRDWWVHDINITNEVNKWMKENNITWPFDENALMQFKLRFL